MAGDAVLYYVSVEVEDEPATREYAVLVAAITEDGATTLGKMGAIDAYNRSMGGWGDDPKAKVLGLRRAVVPTTPGVVMTEEVI